MKKRKGFTLIELLVVIAIIAVLMVILMPALKRAKEQGQRAVCISNMKQLALCWILYCDDNDDKIVNGAPLGTEGTAIGDSGTGHANEIPWIGVAFSGQYTQGVQLSERTQIDAIRRGGLWPYALDLKLYSCPSGYRGEMVTYAAFDGVNGLRRNNTTKRGCYLKKRTEIRGAQALRMVYIDEGWVTPDSFAVNYDNEAWWDDPTVRHGDGTNIAFADGRAEYHKWKGTETIMFGRNQDRTHTSACPTDTDEGKQDLHYIQKGCWGDLGYTPSVW